MEEEWASKVCHLEGGWVARLWAKRGIGGGVSTGVSSHAGGGMSRKKEGEGRNFLDGRTGDFRAGDGAEKRVDGGRAAG